MDRAAPFFPSLSHRPFDFAWFALSHFAKARASTKGTRGSPFFVSAIGGDQVPLPAAPSSAAAMSFVFTTQSLSAPSPWITTGLPS